MKISPKEKLYIHPDFSDCSHLFESPQDALDQIDEGENIQEILEVQVVRRFKIINSARKLIEVK